MWKLEGTGSVVQRYHGAPMEPISREVVLIDPNTYLPVVEREVDVTSPRHRVLNVNAIGQLSGHPTGTGEHLIV